MTSHDSRHGDLVDVVTSLTRRRPVEFLPVAGGHSEALRRVVLFADGSTAFVKCATEPLSAEWLEVEVRTYEAIRSDLLPELLSAQSGPVPALLMQDLRSAQWPPPWNAAQLGALLGSLEDLARMTAPPGFEHLAERESLLKSWQRLRSRPELLEHLRGIVSDDHVRWIEKHLDALIDLDGGLELGGTSVVHRDLRSDNVCFLDGAPKVVDWGGTAVGNPLYDTASLLISAHHDGAEVRRHLTADVMPFVSLHAGYYASRAPLADPFPGSSVRPMQRQQLLAAIELLRSWWPLGPLVAGGWVSP